jgi:hypothetical protein
MEDTYISTLIPPGPVGGKKSSFRKEGRECRTCLHSRQAGNEKPRLSHRGDSDRPGLPSRNSDTTNQLRYRPSRTAARFYYAPLSRAHILKEYAELGVDAAAPIARGWHLETRRGTEGSGSLGWLSCKLQHGQHRVFPTNRAGRRQVRKPAVVRLLPRRLERSVRRLS